MNYIDGNDNLLIKEQKRVRMNVVNQYVCLRKEKKLTQSDISLRMGIKRPNITRFESGQYNPTLDMLVKMAKCMGMHLEILLKEDYLNNEIGEQNE